MTRPRRTRVRALALALLLLAASLGAGAVAGQAAASGSVTQASDPAIHASTVPTAGAPTGHETVGPGVDANRSEVAPITRCFTGSGYPISIGDGEGGATMETVIHLSVLTDPGAGNEFGVETAGRLDGEPIVALAAGVRLTGREAIANGFDPLAAFDVLYTYELQLPMFAGSVGDADYEDDGSPIESSAGAVDC
ncbi:DUF7332 family protein [Halorubrum distributum]|uniref:Uncharacterized protein n=1 Tax=Halorubrum distributum JCM 10247 TaxID=1227486 RepID=M0DGY5_9EURY|nr:hypothetical protein [Halorubrum terrestre]ELZ34735.1 hypothetical protein C473_05150 [Halorubrum terrestre JCM 10247]